MNRMVIKSAAAIALALCVGGAFAEEMPVIVDEPIVTLSPEEQAEQIRTAQQHLIDLGFLDGRADGYYGPKTEAALKAFQQRYGLEETGAMDDEETLALLEETAGKVHPIQEAQQRLVDLGYLTGKADGQFGARSQDALKLFQQIHGLEATGGLDEETDALLFAEDAEALPEPLASGDQGDEVTAIQERLIQLGFLSGSADGRYGRNTANAVRYFQKHLDSQDYAGITANGAVSPATRYFLEKADYSSYLYDIAQGDKNTEVVRVERRLVQLGYMDLAADNVLDEYALLAVQAFQAQVGLKAGDTVDKATVDALFQPDAPEAETYVPHDISYGNQGRAVEAAEAALAQGGMITSLPGGRYSDDVKQAVQRLYSYLTKLEDPRAELFARSEFLSVEAQQALAEGVLGYRADIDGNSSSEEIRRLQARLHTLCYLARTSVDGKLGDRTREAIKTFQEANGLEVTGNVDEATQTRLFSGEAIENRLPYRVEVSIAEQRVYAYELSEAGEYELQSTFICSTGLGNSTPRGIFLDGFPVDRWHYFAKYNCWAQYGYVIEGNIMFHSVIYSSANEGSIRMGSVYDLGSKASHGCIRLRVDDARWIFEHCAKGKTVIVIR